VEGDQSRTCGRLRGKLEEVSASPRRSKIFTPPALGKTFPRHVKGRGEGGPRRGEEGLNYALRGSNKKSGSKNTGRKNVLREKEKRKKIFLHEGRPGPSAKDTANRHPISRRQDGDLFAEGKVRRNVLNFEGI